MWRPGDQENGAWLGPTVDGGWKASHGCNDASQAGHSVDDGSKGGHGDRSSPTGGDRAGRVPSPSTTSLEP